MAFETQAAGSLFWLRSGLLAGQNGLTHAFSTRLGGVSGAPWDTLNLGVGRGDDAEHVAENYRRFLTPLGLDPRQAVLSKQVHEDTVRTVSRSDAGKGLLFPRDYTADALITDEPGLPLVVFSADCIILLLYDPVRRCVGAVHAGWRGTALGIARRAVEQMRQVYGSRPADLLAAIGPGIGPCCFETHEDVPRAMRRALGEQALPYMQKDGEKWHVDLKGLNARWLALAGVEQIDCCSLCTGCRPDWFWSHRKLGNARGAQVAVIALQ